MSQAEPSLFTFLLAFALLNSQQRDHSALLTAFWSFSNPLLQTLPYWSCISPRGLRITWWGLSQQQPHASESNFCISSLSGCCDKTFRDSNLMRALDWFKFCFVAYGLSIQSIVIGKARWQGQLSAVATWAWVDWSHWVCSQGAVMDKCYK